MTTPHAAVGDPLDVGLQEKLLGTLHSYKFNVQQAHVTTVSWNLIKTASVRRSHG